jgi:hypothetical protein
LIRFHFFTIWIYLSNLKIFKSPDPTFSTKIPTLVFLIWSIRYASYNPVFGQFEIPTQLWQIFIGKFRLCDEVKMYSIWIVLVSLGCYIGKFLVSSSQTIKKYEFYSEIIRLKHYFNLRFRLRKQKRDRIERTDVYFTIFVITFSSSLLL